MPCDPNPIKIYKLSSAEREHNFFGDRYNRCILACKIKWPSSYLFTFHTPWGRKQFLLMPFRLSSVSEVMQKRNEENFGDISVVHVIAYDLTIAAPTKKQYDITFKAVSTGLDIKMLGTTKIKYDLK